MKKVFITSITGAQGASIAKVFKREGYAVAAMTRSDVQSEDYELVQGSFSDTALLVSLMKDCQAVVLTLPLIFETQAVQQITQHIVAATKAADVKTIIFNSSIPLGESKTGYAAIDVKHDALELLNQSGLNIITLMPTLYLDNLSSEFLLPVIREAKIIPYPVADELEFNWISHENLGRYCVAAVQKSSLYGQKILITNKGKNSKQDIAALIGGALNTKVNYVAATPEQFEDNLKPVLGDYVANEIANLYRGVAENSDSFTHYRHQQFIDSVNLQTTEQWVKSVAW